MKYLNISRGNREIVWASLCIDLLRSVDYLKFVQYNEFVSQACEFYQFFKYYTSGVKQVSTV